MDPAFNIKIYIKQFELANLVYIKFHPDDQYEYCLCLLCLLIIAVQACIKQKAKYKIRLKCAKLIKLGKKETLDFMAIFLWRKCYNKLSVNILTVKVLFQDYFG